jgi:hypothetical protein
MYRQFVRQVGGAFESHWQSYKDEVSGPPSRTQGLDMAAMPIADRVGHKLLKSLAREDRVMP